MIVLAHLSAAQRRALVIADNQLALNAGWDESMLRAELAALETEAFDLNLIGFDEGELERLLAEQSKQEFLDPNAVPDLPEFPVSRVGDLWILGEHRLFCGDAIRQEMLETLLDSSPAAMVFTDLPSNHGSKSFQQIPQNAGEPGPYESLHSFYTPMIESCQGAIYLCMSSWELVPMVHRAFTDAGGHSSNLLIWDKHHPKPDRSEYRQQYQPILYGWPKDRKPHWAGSRNQSDVWSIPSMSQTKPTELVERALENSSKSGDLVLDPFAGSGTTLIACQCRKRKARLMELDPRYVDQICLRWQQFSGQPAVLGGENLSFEVIARHRRNAA